jgi:hypothetical protein
MLFRDNNFKGKQRRLQSIGGSYCKGTSPRATPPALQICSRREDIDMKEAGGKALVFLSTFWLTKSPKLSK